MDHDTLLTQEFRMILDKAGFPVKRTRFWSTFTLKNGIVRKAIWLDERALNDAVVEFTHVHYLTKRPHRGLDNTPPQPVPVGIDLSKPVLRQDRLGGLIRVYRRAA